MILDLLSLDVIRVANFNEIASPFFLQPEFHFAVAVPVHYSTNGSRVIQLEIVWTLQELPQIAHQVDKNRNIEIKLDKEV